ncbi:glycosyltransferase [Pendulispora rubella]|uniref:Glycosyltransferase n=1 Tax=Pendulispora rubella TaxID=2741070 RepID=A0ABZ2LL49_9BACT
MKVVDVTEFYSIRGGGVRSHLSEKGHISCQLGHDHWVVAPGEKTTLQVVEKDENATGQSRLQYVGGPALPYDPTYHLLWRVDAVHRLVRQERPDVLEIHSPYVAAGSSLSLPRKYFGIRTFVWHADFIDTYLRGALTRRLSPSTVDVVVEPLWAWVRTIANGCDATFAASRWQAEKLTAHGVRGVTYLPFGVDKGRFTPGARNEAVKAEILGPRAGAGGPLLVAIGRFAVEKRWDVVLDAFTALREERRRKGLPAATLAVFGDGPERAAMQAQVAGHDDVLFFGFVKDRNRLASVLASADLLIHGCPYETFGLGIAEAVSCGLPIVVPDEGGAAEQALPGASEIYPTGDATACMQATQRLLGRDRTEVLAYARRAADLVPSVEDHFKHLFSMYEDLSKRRRQSPPRKNRRERSRIDPRRFARIP